MRSNDNIAQVTIGERLHLGVLFGQRDVRAHYLDRRPLYISWLSELKKIEIDIPLPESEKAHKVRFGAADLVIELADWIERFDSALQVIVANPTVGNSIAKLAHAEVARLFSKNIVFGEPVDPSA